MNLYSTNLSHQNLSPEDGFLFYIENFIDHAESIRLMSALKKEIEFKSYPIKIFGKIFTQPRLISSQADPYVQYSYSKQAVDRAPWTPEVQKLKEKIEAYYQVTLNYVLLNLYRNGGDSMGWHSDNEPELGPDPVIFSLSLGEQRSIHFRHRTKKSSFKINLQNGSLLIMGGCLQTHWQHAILKSKKPLQERLNLTFRNIQN